MDIPSSASVANARETTASEIKIFELIMKRMTFKAEVSGYDLLVLSKMN